MAGINRRIAGSEQRDQRRLRPVNVEDRLVVTLGRDLVEVAVPGLARIEAQLVLRLAEQQVVSALDVGGGEGLPSCHLTP